MLVICLLFIVFGLIILIKPDFLVRGTSRYFKIGYDFIENNKPLVTILCRVYGVILAIAGAILLVKN